MDWARFRPSGRTAEARGVDVGSRGRNSRRQHGSHVPKPARAQRADGVTRQGFQRQSLSVGNAAFVRRVEIGRVEIALAQLLQNRRSFLDPLAQDLHQCVALLAVQEMHVAQ